MTLRPSLLLKVVQLIQDFFTAHPDTSPGITAALAKLRTLGEALRGLTTTTQAGTARSQKGAERFLDLQAEIKAIFLQPLASLARSTYRGFPKRIAEFRLGRQVGKSREGFLARCTAIQEALVANLADFVALGMDPAVPEQFAAALVELAALPAEVNEALVANLADFVALGMDPAVPEQFAAALVELAALPAEVNGGRLARTQARGDIDRTMGQLMATIHQLDGLVRLKYRDDVATLSAWQVARHIPWPNRTTTPETPAGGDAPAGGASAK